VLLVSTGLLFKIADAWKSVGTMQGGAAVAAEDGGTVTGRALRRIHPLCRCERSEAMTKKSKGAASQQKLCDAAPLILVGAR
jgi:hypothetical protein